jgi:uncharacterized protein
LSAAGRQPPVRPGTRIERDSAPPGPVVSGFSDGRFAVGGERFEGLFLTPERAAGWHPPDISALNPADLQPLLDLRPPPEFILLGTGAKLRFPPAAFRRGLEEKGIGLEAMDSRAAARAWGLLRGEGRWIAAALMPLDQSS